MLGVLLARALEPVDLALDRGAHVVGQLELARACVRYSATASSASPSRPAPCGSRPSAGAAGTRAASCPCRRSPRCGSAPSARARPASRAPSASASSRRASASSVSSSSTLRSTDRSGAQPAVSASAPGSSTPASTSAMRGVPSFSAMPRTTARYSRTSSLGPAGHRRPARPPVGLDPQRRAWSLGTVRPDDGPRQAAEHQGPLCRRAARPRSRSGRRCRRGCSRCRPGARGGPGGRRRWRRRRRHAPRRSRAPGSRPSAGRTTPVVRGSSGRVRASASGVVGHRGSPMGDYTIT